MSTSPGHFPRIKQAIAGVIATLCIAGCASSQTAAPAPKQVDPVARAAVVPRSDVGVDVTFGGVAVVPLGQTLDASIASRPSELSLDNGTRITVMWRWANAAIDNQTATGSSEVDSRLRISRAWFGPASTWTTSDAPGESAFGTWLAVLTLPRSCDGRSLVLGMRTLHFRVLEPSSRLVAPPAGGAWPHSWVGVTDPMLSVARSSPGTRWWARLVSDGLRSRITRIGPAADATTDAGAQTPPDLDRFSDPVLELWANQQEERWRWALDALAAHDREFAQMLVARIGLVANLEGCGVPFATFADPKLEQLRETLLDQRLDARDRRNAAQAWLENQPASLAWVADDAGAIVRSEELHSVPRAVVSLGIANLTSVPVVAWGGSLADQTAEDASQLLTRVEPRASSTLHVHCDVDSSRDLPPGQFPPAVRLAAHIGDDIVMCDAFASPVAVRPPGFVIPGLVADWTAGSLVAAARENAAAPPIDVRTRGLLERNESNQWMLRLDVADVATSEQVVRLWLGLRRENQTPITEVRLRPAGLEPLIADGPVETSAIRTPDAWVLRFVIPKQEIDPDGVLRLAIERIGAGGRVSWPRPMLPWQMEPGRFALDLRAWDQVGRGR